MSGFECTDEAKTVRTNDVTYIIGCAPAAGHSTSIRVEQFATVRDGQTSFDTIRGEKAVEDFHGCPISRWEEAYYGGKEQIWLWQADEWLITITAVDDTPYPIAPDPREVSEELYRIGVAEGLFSNCE
jgi:hypothetical protein